MILLGDDLGLVPPPSVLAPTVIPNVAPPEAIAADPGRRAVWNERHAAERRAARPPPLGPFDQVP